MNNQTPAPWTAAHGFPRATPLDDGTWRFTVDHSDVDAQLATIRKTLQTVRTQRDHVISLLRDVRATGLIPKGDLQRRINCAVATESDD